jgi:hypothetical protein
VELNIAGRGGSRVGARGTVRTGAWHHLAFTYAEAAGRRVYVDGVQVDASNISGKLPRNDSVLLRLGQGYGPEETFDGLMDEVMVFDVALPPEQIRGLSRGGAW